MTKILWAIIFFSAYIYITTSDNDQYFLEKGKEIYESISLWFEDADLDFHLKKESDRKTRKRWR